jgi:ElaB/YqjD/DUF883 family membrane-anchored ribosome-binding protein
MATAGDFNKERDSKREQSMATTGDFNKERDSKGEQIMAITDDSSKEIDQLKKEFTVLRTDLGSLVSTLKNLAGKQGEKVVDLAENAKETVRNQTKATGESVEQYIKERPLTSALIAFGGGFVVGVLLSNKR